MAANPDVRDRGLIALILCGGSGVRAHDLLVSQGHTEYAVSTLHDWRTRYAERYEELQRTLAPRIAERIAAEAEAFVIQATHTEALLLKSLAEDIPKLSANEKAGALRNVTTAKSLNLDKIASPLRGRPSRIVASPDVDQLLTGLRRLVNAPSPNNAAEITEAQPALAERVS